MTAQLDLSNLPCHVAIIMDGNGRWAKKKKLPRVMGHKKGANSAKEVIKTARELGIKVLTLYAFSLENWKRPKNEVDALMNLLTEYLKKELNEIVKNGISLRVIGETEMLPKEAQDILYDVIKKTANNHDMILNLALSYSSRSEIARAARRIAKKCLSGEIKLSDIDEEMISKNLNTTGIPDPDLIIRTSGEMRISNFLLFQAAYSEFYFTPTLWPDFDKEQFLIAINEYQKRERRFGHTGEQISGQS